MREWEKHTADLERSLKAKGYDIGQCMQPLEDPIPLSQLLHHYYQHYCDTPLNERLPILVQIDISVKEDSKVYTECSMVMAYDQVKGFKVQNMRIDKHFGLRNFWKVNHAALYFGYHDQIPPKDVANRMVAYNIQDIKLAAQQLQRSLELKGYTGDFNLPPTHFGELSKMIEVHLKRWHYGEIKGPPFPAKFMTYLADHVPGVEHTQCYFSLDFDGQVNLKIKKMELVSKRVGIQMPVFKTLSFNSNEKIPDQAKVIKYIQPLSIKNEIEGLWKKKFKRGKGLS